MALISRDLLRGYRRRAVYLARTEGTAVMLRRMGMAAGLLPRREPPAPAPPPPPMTRLRDSAWPPSALVIGDPGPRRGQLEAGGYAVLERMGEDLSAQQLVSLIYVLSASRWPGPDTLAEARRLGQRVVLELLPGESAPGGATVVSGVADL